MGIVKRLETDEIILKRIKDCRDANMNVQRNFVAGTIIIRADDIVVLRGMKVSENEWQMEYNDEYWDELRRENNIPETYPGKETGNV